MTADLIPRLMDDLASDWGDDVQSAMHALASLGHSVVLPLLDAIEGSEPKLRHHAAMVLEQLQPQEALPPLIELLTEELVPVESKLILTRVLVNLMGEGDTEEGLLDLLTILSTDQAPEVRQVAATGLGKSQSTLANVELCRLAQDPSEAVRQEAQHQLASRSREKKANGITPLEPAMLEAAARLLVRNGLSDSRKEAITVMLTEGEGVARDLLPLLNDAGAKTLQEVTPLLKHINDAKAHVPLMDIAVDQEKPWQRRQMALRSLHKLRQGDEFLQELFRKLLHDPHAELRLEAIAGLVDEEIEDLNAVLLDALEDDVVKVRTQAAQLLAVRLTPIDRSRLAPMLAALSQNPTDEGRLHLLHGLSLVLVGSPGDHLFVPEIIDLLDPSNDEAFTVALDILEKIVPRAPSAQTSRSLLALLAAISESQLTEKLLAILVRILPRNTVEATPPLNDLLLRFDTVPIVAFVLRLLGRTADAVAVNILISFAQSTHAKSSENLARLAQQLLGTLEGTLSEVSLENGQYSIKPGLVCQCGERLTWREKDGREELWCEICEEEYVLLEPFALVLAKDVTTPFCICPPCKRKYPLKVEDNDLLRCPKSNEQYVIRLDTQLPAMLAQLEFGLCECCDKPQPMELKGDEVICLRTGRRPKDTQEHAALPLHDTIETPMQIFSVNDTSSHQRPRSTRSNRSTRTSINSPTTQTRIRSFQLRQTLLAETAEVEETTESLVKENAKTKE